LLTLLAVAPGEFTGPSVSRIQSDMKNRKTCGDISDFLISMHRERAVSVGAQNGVISGEEGV
jgi:hypothetical protein